VLPGVASAIQLSNLRAIGGVVASILSKCPERNERVSDRAKRGARPPYDAGAPAVGVVVFFPPAFEMTTILPLHEACGPG
jgi:hypothetical protein